MKVLIINTVPFIRDGISSVIMSHYRSLKDRIDFDFVVNTEIIDSFKDEIMSGNSKIHFIKTRKKNPLAYFFFIKKITENNEYDVIHVHGNSSLMSLELMAIKNKHKVIVHGHNVKTNYPLLNYFLKPYFRRNFGVGLVPSEEAGTFLFETENYRILPNGVNLAKYVYNPQIRREIHEMLGVCDEKVIICVGNLNEQKYQDLLITILPTLLEREKCIVLLVGEGERKEKLMTLAKENQVAEYVKFLGSVPNVHDYYSAADVFVLPTHFESFSVVAVEGQVNGLPCIVSDYLPKIIKQTEDLHFVSNNDLDTWIELILNVKRAYKDRDLSFFDINTISEELFQIYEKVSLIG